MISCCGAVKGFLKTVATADVNAVFVVFEVSVVGGGRHKSSVSALVIIMLFLSLP